MDAIQRKYRLARYLIAPVTFLATRALCTGHYLAGVAVVAAWFGYMAWLGRAR